MPFVDSAQGANAILAVSMAVCRAGASASEGHLGVGFFSFHEALSSYKVTSFFPPKSDHARSN